MLNSAPLSFFKDWHSYSGFPDHKNSFPRPASSWPSTTRLGQLFFAPSTPSSTGTFSSPKSSSAIFTLLLARSPDELLEEIILVDDASDMNHVKEQLDDYMAQYPKAGHALDLTNPLFFTVYANCPYNMTKTSTRFVSSVHLSAWVWSGLDY